MISRYQIQGRIRKVLLEMERQTRVLNERGKRREHRETEKRCDVNWRFQAPLVKCNHTDESLKSYTNQVFQSWLVFMWYTDTGLAESKVKTGKL